MTNAQAAKWGDRLGAFLARLTIAGLYGWLVGYEYGAPLSIITALAAFHVLMIYDVLYDIRKLLEEKR